MSAALKGPEAIKEIVEDNRCSKADGIGYIFIQSQPFLKEIGESEIDDHA